jgi:hypothetical protein
MPGVRGKEFDTTNWHAKDWRRARLWNATFLMTWCAFFVYGVLELLALRNWIMLAAVAMLGIIGAIPQIVWLVRVSFWLHRSHNRFDH